KEEGTGLGMLMVYSTINKVKGIIEVESEKGKGTTFLITIPA
ncbi:ATP-binding protein, partial [Metabacillus herbersteinensis]